MFNMDSWVRHRIKEAYVPPNDANRWRMIFSAVPTGLKCLNCGRSLAVHIDVRHENYYCNEQGGSVFTLEEDIELQQAVVNQDPNIMFRKKKMRQME